MKRKIATTFLVLLALLPLLYAFKFKPQVEELTLKQAIDKGYIRCTFENNKGYTHYSQCLLAKITNTSNKLISLKIENGTQVNPEDSVYQNLIVTENLFVSLNPQENRALPIYAMCTEPHDRAPGTNHVTYTLNKDAQGVMKAVTELITSKHYQNSEGQQAVWCVASNSGLDNISGYDTVAVKNLQLCIAKLTGKKIPPPPAPDDYKRNYYAPTYVKKITVGGEFEFSFAKPRNILVGMFDKNNVLVRELYKKDGETPGAHKQKYEFDGSVYTDSYYYIRLIADGQTRLETKITM